MKVIGTERRICECCMEEHDVKRVLIRENNIFKETKIEYKAEYFYCDQADEFFADEEMISANDIAMKDAYRKAKGLLTTEEIIDIRSKYGISQGDLCALLGWGAKTITRYESHQVQDNAHDTILRKIDADPEWFLLLLRESKQRLQETSYEKYLKTGKMLYEKDHNSYLKKAIFSQYARFADCQEFSGNRQLSLEKVADVIRYYANSSFVRNLYKVKLMKLLWYADALSYKRAGNSITGLVYRALPMGAVPIAHDSIIDLDGIYYEEEEIGEGTAYHFQAVKNKEYPYLTEEERAVLDTVIEKFGKMSTDEIVKKMHQEQAYIQTVPREVISFRHALDLSLS